MSRIACCCIFAFIVSIAVVAYQPTLAAETGRSRLAVVISNADYSQLGALRNPTADGTLVASALRSVGFNVTHLRNLNDQQFRAALRQVARDSARADVTLLYYAGHGVQIGGVNYLLPVDISPPEREDDIRLASVSVDDVLSVIKSPYKIVVLDACRDNPILGRALARGRGASYKRGLASVAPSADTTGGVFIAFSTQTDAIAMDGEGAYSPFAESFASYVGAHASIDDMFAMVTRDVLQKTNGFQRPFKYASLDTVFCLTGDCPAIASDAIGARTSVRAPHEFSESVKEIFARLNAEKSTDARMQLEQQLWQQLQATLPKRIVYGKVNALDGSTQFFGFEPPTAFSDGRRASATVRQAHINGSTFTFDETSSDDDSINCDKHEFITTKTQRNGAVKLFSQAEQKAGAFLVTEGSVAESLFGVLCTAPLRLTPLWAVDKLEWTPIGGGIAAATAIYYQDPTAGDVRFLFIQAQVPKPEDFTGENQYGWLGINCRTKEFRGGSYFGATEKGAVISVFGNTAPWAPFEVNSPAANAHVLLCDR